MALTYRQLRDQINKLSKDHLDDNVSIWDSSIEEMLPVDGTFLSTDESDILDAGCLVLAINQVNED